MLCICTFVKPTPREVVRMCPAPLPADLLLSVCANYDTHYSCTTAGCNLYLAPTQHPSLGIDQAETCCVRSRVSVERANIKSLVSSF